MRVIVLNVLLCFSPFIFVFIFFLCLFNPVDINVRIVTDGERFGVRKFGFSLTMLDLTYPEKYWWSGRHVSNACWGTKQEAIEAYKFLMRKKNIVDVKDVEIL